MSSSPTPASPQPSPQASNQVVVIGGGPAGLMAAQTLLAGGAQVHLYDAMPSVGRKFLLAGLGGLNLTHSEPMAPFLRRYGTRQETVAIWLDALSPTALRAWADGLGQATFVGSSGRVFPKAMKAAPLLRTWLAHMRKQGLVVHSRHRWLGWREGDDALHLRFQGSEGEREVPAETVVLALGGASWPSLGSDGAWCPALAQRGVAIAPWRAANCGFDAAWSLFFADKFAGAAMKSVSLSFDDGQGAPFSAQGEFVITQHGVEGSLIYAVAARVRDAIEREGQATVRLDLVPGRTVDELAARLKSARGPRTVAKHLKEHAGLDGVKAALLRETMDSPTLLRMVDTQAAELARQLKTWPLTLLRPRPVAEAISSAGGVRLEDTDQTLMLKRLPGVFCAGEMLDWEAPTGGYLLTGAMASGVVAGQGALAWLATARKGRNTTASA